MAAAVALSRIGVRVSLVEQAPAFGEVGAGIQLGPNAVRVLDGWGLLPAVRSVAAAPQRLLVRSADDGRELGRLRLGSEMTRRYGMPYLCVHRADIHAVLLAAARSSDAVTLALDSPVDRYETEGQQVRLFLRDGSAQLGDALIGCDGLWSRVRQQLLNDGPPRVPCLQKHSPRDRRHRRKLAPGKLPAWHNSTAR